MRVECDNRRDPRCARVRPGMPHNTTLNLTRYVGASRLGARRSMANPSFEPASLGNGNTYAWLLKTAQQNYFPSASMWLYPFGLVFWLFVWHAKMLSKIA